MGYVLKDFYLGRKYLVIGVTAFFAMIMFSYILRFSFIYGNLSVLEEDYAYMTDIIFNILPGFVLMVLGVLAVVAPIYADVAAGWNIFAYASPVGDKKTVALKVYQMAAVWIVSSLAAGAASAVYGGVFGGELAKSGFRIFMVIALFILAVFALMLSLAYKYGNSNSVGIRTLIIVLVLVYAITGILVVTGSINLEDSESIRTILQPVTQWWSSHIPAMTVALLCTGTVLLGGAYKMAVRVYTRRAL